VNAARAARSRHGALQHSFDAEVYRVLGAQVEALPVSCLDHLAHDRGATLPRLVETSGD
jgi:hypothetical protein